MTFAERSPWIERIGWEDTYRDLNRAVLLSLLGLPSRSGHSDLHLGHHVLGGQEVAIVSLAKDEQRIAVLLVLFDQLMD